MKYTLFYYRKNCSCEDKSSNSEGEIFQSLNFEEFTNKIIEIKCENMNSGPEIAVSDITIMFDAQIVCTEIDGDYIKEDLSDEYFLTLKNLYDRINYEVFKNYKNYYNN